MKKTNYKYDEEMNTDGYNTMIKPYDTTHTEANTKAKVPPPEKKKKPRERRGYAPMADEVNMGLDNLNPYEGNGVCKPLRSFPSDRYTITTFPDEIAYILGTFGYSSKDITGVLYIREGKEFKDVWFTNMKIFEGESEYLPNENALFCPLDIDVDKDLVHTGYSNDYDEPVLQATTGIKQAKARTRSDGRRVIRGVPKKRRSWKRRYSGTSFPYMERNNTPEIMAIRNSLEDMVIEYYNDRIDSIKKDLEVTGLDNFMKDKILDWVFQNFKNQIDKMGIDFVDYFDEAGYLSFFDKQIENIQKKKMMIVLK